MNRRQKEGRIAEGSETDGVVKTSQPRVDGVFCGGGENGFSLVRFLVTLLKEQGAIEKRAMADELFIAPSKSASNFSNSVSGLSKIDDGSGAPRSTCLW